MIDHARLVELLDYDRDTGTFTWKVARSNGVRPGSKTGRVDSRGYLQVCVGGRRYLAHRLAWFYTHKAWPEAEIDHINGDRLDNSASNLRAVSRLENARNKRLYAGSRSGVSGVRREKAAWVAYVSNKYIGTFTDIDAAIAARMGAQLASGYHANHGRV